MARLGWSLVAVLLMVALCGANSVRRPSLRRERSLPSLLRPQLPFPKPGGPVDCCGPNPIILCINYYCPPEDILARAKRQTTIGVSGGSGGVNLKLSHATKKLGTFHVSGSLGPGGRPSWGVGWSLTLGKRRNKKN